MHGAFGLVLLAALKEGHAGAQGVADTLADDTFVDAMVNALFDRTVQASSFPKSTSLENATLAKGLSPGSGQLAASSATSAALQPRIVSRTSCCRLPHTSSARTCFLKMDVSRGQGAGAGVLCKAGDHSTLPGLNCDVCEAQGPPFKGVDSSAVFVGTLDAMVKGGKLPPKVQAGFVDLQSSYKAAISKSPAAEKMDVDKEATEVVGAIAERVLTEFMSPFTFESRHERVLAPFDYYCMGQRYVGNLINFDTSYVGYADRLMDIKAAVARGENVLLLANHQSEADPGVWSWLTNAVTPELASDLYYVAGDRVVLDTMAKPFSMGRNLICVHSKKHMDDDPELRKAKMATNQKSVLEMGKLFKKGGAIVWVAPSGGRDRKEDGEYVPSKFDPSAVMLLKRMMEKSPIPGHVYPLAMVSAEIMPPPSGVEKDLGEKRVLDYHGVGISFGEELNSEAIIGGIEDKEQAAQAYTKAAYSQVQELYAPLADAVYGKSKAGAEFSQPWKS